MDYSYVDLHIHSYFSDGTDSPQEIYKKAIVAGVECLAITDHDTIEGTIELKKICENSGLKAIAGVELTAVQEGRDIHVLGYGMDLKSIPFQRFVSNNRRLLYEVNTLLIEKMESDYPEVSLIDYEMYEYDRKKGGWKTLHYLIKKRLAENLKEALSYYEKYQVNYACVPFFDISEVCDEIHGAGGKAIFAHPGKSLSYENDKEFESKCCEYLKEGFDGIECYHPSHTDSITRICVDLCNQKGLMITCGSDFHGKFSNTSIGQIKAKVRLY